jgi:hypothetical protein
MKDGGLRPIFRSRLTGWQITSIETAGSASGVPDSEYCSPEGVAGWIEFKQTKIFHVHIKPLQVAWLMRRCRYGGTAFIAVRRTPFARKFANVDELWIMKGDQAEALFNRGLQGVKALCWEGGPNQWNFDEIKTVLNNQYFTS